MILAVTTLNRNRPDWKENQMRNSTSATVRRRNGYILVLATVLLAGCGMTTTVQVGERVTVGPGAHGVAVALCPDGMVATGGGFSFSNKAVQVVSSAPKEAVTGEIPVGWRVTFDNAASFEVGVEAIAVCATRG